MICIRKHLVIVFRNAAVSLLSSEELQRALKIFHSAAAIIEDQYSAEHQNIDYVSIHHPLKEQKERNYMLLI